MFDFLRILETASVGALIKEIVATGISWAKSRKKPAPEVVQQKVEEIVAEATNKVLPDTIKPAQREQVVSGLIEIVRPTLDQVMEFSPNTARIIVAAREGRFAAGRGSAAKKAAPRKAAKKATAHRAAKKAAKKAIHKTAKTAFKRG